MSRTMTSSSWVNRSTPVRSVSVTMPTGRSPTVTMAAPCARLCSSTRASPTVMVGVSVIGVS